MHSFSIIDKNVNIPSNIFNNKSVNDNDTLKTATFIALVALTVRQSLY